MEAGTRLARYVILSPLGAGGMGEVYRARDERLGRDVAIKILPGETSDHQVALERFRREARTLAALSHPNLVSIFDVGRDADRDFVVMELLEGETLRSRLERGPLEPAEAVRTGAGIARALAAAHERGVIHRDLKPENVYLTTEGRVKVLDFGLARESWREGGDPEIETRVQLTADGTVLGTPGYMAPEQVRGQPATAQSDVFALGCILHEMLSGRNPFHRGSMGETLSAVLRDAPSDLADLVHVPPALAELVRRCLSKPPGERPGSGVEVAAALHSMKGAGEAPGRRWPRRATLAYAAGATLLVVLALLVALWRPGAPAPAASGELRNLRSVAVMPVTDILSEESPESGYLGAGVTESWIRSLSSIADLKVISRASVFRYAGRPVDPVQAGKELRVEGLLLGEIRPEGEDIALSVELVDAEDGSHLWGETLRGPRSDLLVLQERLAARLAERLGRASVAPVEGSSSRVTRDPEAHRLYLQGRFHWNQREAASLRRALELFDQALARDPTFALALAGKADVYNVLHVFANMPASETFPRAAAAAERALELDPGLAEAHTSLAYVKHYWQRDWEAAEAGYRQALELNPSYAVGWQWYAELLTSLGRFEEAEAAGRKAMELDPLSPIIHAVVGWNLEMARRYAEAIRHDLEILRIFPDFNTARIYLARAYVQNGQADRGVEILEENWAIHHDRPTHGCWLAWAYARAGRTDDALRLTRELQERSERGEYVLPYYLAYPYLDLGEREAALDLLEEAYRQRVEQLLWLYVDPALDPLRDSPRFAALLRDAGFPTESSPAVRPTP